LSADPFAPILQPMRAEVPVTTMPEPWHGPAGWHGESWADVGAALEHREALPAGFARRSFLASLAFTVGVIVFVVLLPAYV
jgi:hypothetical protein